MFVKEMDVQDLDSPRPGGVERTLNPSWDEIDHAIHTLDGKRRSNMGLKISDEYLMAIGGGKEAFICQVFPYMFRLLNPAVASNADEVIRLVVGQVGEYWVKECVPIELVLQAAKHYWRTGEIDNRLLWEKYA